MTLFARAARFLQVEKLVANLPGQLLTGMYGMNFQQKDGEPGIPELMFAYPWGYVWFWCCFLTCSLSMVAYFKYYRRWI